MRNKIVLLMYLIATVSLSSVIVNQAAASPVTTIKVNPTTSVASVGESFTVEIKIEDVEDLYSWEFRLRWSGSLLNVTSVTEGDFLSRAGVRATYFVPKIFNGPDPKGVSNYVYATCTLLGKVTGEYASGTLATITFLVEAEGDSVLDIYGTLMYDSLFPFTPPIEHGLEDGYFSVTPPKFQVEPERIVNSSLTSGATFSVNVSISNVVDLYGFGFNMSYDTTILNATDVTVVPFLNEPVSVDKGIDDKTRFVWVDINSTASESVSGNGTLATVTFQVIGTEPGQCVLDVYDTRLNDTLARLGPPFEHSPPAVDGYFSNEAIHDLAVTAVRPYPVEVAAGDSVSINVTVRNLGGFNEIFNVTLYYDGNIIDTQMDITIEAGDKKTLTFDWDTTGLAEGAYAIKAEATVVEGETDIANNTQTYSSVTVKKSAPSILLYVAVGIVIVIGVVILVYFLKFRKPKST
jgi:hypothetical protein